MLCIFPIFVRHCFCARNVVRHFVEPTFQKEIMIIRKILITVIFGLLIWLLIDNLLHIEIATTKNNYIINSEKLKADSFQNIDSVKVFAKSKLDIIRQNTKNNSIIATERMWILLGIILLLITYLTFYKFVKKDNIKV